MELGEVRKKRLELDKVNDLKDGIKGRFDEFIQAINSRESLLEEFDEEIFNALVEKIVILTPTHFVFELKSGMKVEEIVEQQLDKNIYTPLRLYRNCLTPIHLGMKLIAETIFQFSGEHGEKVS